MLEKSLRQIRKKWYKLKHVDTNWYGLRPKDKKRCASRTMFSQFVSNSIKLYQVVSFFLNLSQWIFKHFVTPQFVKPLIYLKTCSCGVRPSGRCWAAAGFSKGLLWAAKLQQCRGCPTCEALESLKKCVCFFWLWNEKNEKGLPPDPPSNYPCIFGSFFARPFFPGKGANSRKC